MALEEILNVADAVLYEGYLLYPYRSTSAKNQTRWQFGVLGPPGAAAAGVGEESALHCECLLDVSPAAAITLHVRSLQLQSRLVEELDPHSGNYEPVRQLRAGGQVFVSWDEAVPQTFTAGPLAVGALSRQLQLAIEVDGGEEVEQFAFSGEAAGRIIRRRWPLRATVAVQATDVGDGSLRLAVELGNVTSCSASAAQQATRTSLLGAHLVLQADNAAFVSLLEPPARLQTAAAECDNRRCWPVLAGVVGASDAMLVSPIILYDYPAVAPESAGSLFDSTEIDEILTLRVMTLTDAEKAEARATDAAAAAIIDRCEQMSGEELLRLHGIVHEVGGTARTAHVLTVDGEAVDDEVGNADDWDEQRETAIPVLVTPEEDPDIALPWWDPGIDAAVSPTTDAIVIDGIAVVKGSAVRLHPARAADAQDIFFANEPATVTAILSDVDGGSHIAVVLDNDPAADLHEWYGRYLYFAPEEIEPLDRPRAALTPQMMAPLMKTKTRGERRPREPDPDESSEGVVMRRVGIVATGISVLVGAAAIVLAIASLGDVKRYIKMRRM